MFWAKPKMDNCCYQCWKSEKYLGAHLYLWLYRHLFISLLLPSGIPFCTMLTSLLCEYSWICDCVFYWCLYGNEGFLWSCSSVRPLAFTFYFLQQHCVVSRASFELNGPRRYFACRNCGEMGKCSLNKPFLVVWLNSSHSVCLNSFCDPKKPKYASD